jgi:hypothetical protein
MDFYFSVFHSLTSVHVVFILCAAHYFVRFLRSAAWPMTWPDVYKIIALGGGRRAPERDAKSCNALNKIILCFVQSKKKASTAKDYFIARGW